MAAINRETLKKFITAFCNYEIVTHGVNPHDSLLGTSMRVENNEGYKYRVLKNWDINKKQYSTYVEAILKTFPGVNLVHFQQISKVKKRLEKDGRDQFENALKLLYEGSDDQKAFAEIVSAIGANFDTMSFLFFLRDPNSYVTVKSSLFDKRFKMIGIDSKLSGNCTWEKYQQFNSWIKEIQNILCDSVNSEFTLIDAHSFLWLLPEFEKYISGSEQEDDYQRAANILKNYAIEESLDSLTADSEIIEALDEFKAAYSPDILDALSDDVLLPYLFYTVGDNVNALCCYLEMNKACRSYFGSISGGSAYKFGLFQKKETEQWMTGSPQKPQELSEEEALVLGKTIREALVNGARIIADADLHTLEDYEKLDLELHETLGDRFYNLGWIHKYFSIIFNDKLSCFHSTEWQLHVLRALKIEPSDQYYARSGQISMVQKYGGWYYRQLFEIFEQKFGYPRQFFRLGTSDGDKNYASEWTKRQVIGIGWGDLGDLSEFLHGEGLDRKDIQDKLVELYYPGDPQIASRKAGEISRFYSLGNNSVVVIMDGEKLVAIADNIGDYFYDASSSMPHLKQADWKFTFEGNQKLPKKEEGKLTTCSQLSDKDNLGFLYEKYYYGEDTPNEEVLTVEPVATEQRIEIKYITGLKAGVERNRIIFGAPGTGKSFILNKEANELVEDEGCYERVTFHPDYSYANFVGTYKPVPLIDNKGNDAITYRYVPGPFMRVYVKALKNCQEEEAKHKPFLLIVEEINRANVAAVFGDVFQLLDRNDDNVSEYPIQASEDVKTYLAKELGGNVKDYTKIKIPDNMFIWATMNSADQGVFPMDTAFKRRWDFTYLGIDERDADIRGKYVYLGENKSQKVEWNKLRKAINRFLAKEKINEDKQLGPFFISRNITAPSNTDEIDREKFIRVFKNKVIMYLFEDAARQKRSKLFEGCGQDNLRYSEICSKFDKDGILIFNLDIQREAEPEIMADESK